MENFSFKHDGQTFWYSRSMAVSLFVFTFKDGEVHLLANKRGKGTPDFQGYWNASCGYLDFNETLSQAAARESLEEVGLKLHPNELIEMQINSAVTENRQNVTQRFMTFIPYERFTEDMFSTSLSEKNEVEKIEWIPASKIFNNTDFRNKYNWAFGHDEIAKDFYKSACTLANIHMYSSLENKISIDNIKPRSFLDIKGMKFIVEDYLKGVKYVGNSKVSINNKHYLICNLSNTELKDGDFISGYIASSYKDYNIKIFII